MGTARTSLPEFPEYDFDIVGEDILAVIDHLGIGRAHFVSPEHRQRDPAEAGHRAP